MNQKERTELAKLFNGLNTFHGHLCGLLMDTSYNPEQKEAFISDMNYEWKRLWHTVNGLMDGNLKKLQKDYKKLK